MPLACLPRLFISGISKTKRRLLLADLLEIAIIGSRRAYARFTVNFDLSHCGNIGPARTQSRQNYIVPLFF